MFVCEKPHLHSQPRQQLLGTVLCGQCESASSASQEGLLYAYAGRTSEWRTTGMPVDSQKHRLFVATGSIQGSAMYHTPEQRLGCSARRPRLRQRLPPASSWTRPVGNKSTEELWAKLTQGGRTFPQKKAAPPWDSCRIIGDLASRAASSDFGRSVRQRRFLFVRVGETHSYDGRRGSNVLRNEVC